MGVNLFDNSFACACQRLLQIRQMSFHCVLVSTYSELWLLKVMQRQRLEVVCPGVVLHYGQLPREQTHPEAIKKNTIFGQFN